MRDQLTNHNSHFVSSDNSIRRWIIVAGKPSRPNVIVIAVESLSADFLAHFGSTQQLTPTLNSLANQGLLFNNRYARRTKPVRGMEALSLSIPPTPENSIVRRQHNQNLTTVGNIFKQVGYSRTFYHGGDGYFDNMKKYFGSSGFDITDRGRNLKINDTYLTRRTVIPDRLVYFENAWDISDEDLFNAVIRGADKNSAFEPRTLLGTYQKRAYLKSDSLVILGPQGKAETFLYNINVNIQTPSSLPLKLINEESESSDRT